jgi:competence protein ComEA
MSLIRKGLAIFQVTPEQQKGLFLYALLMFCFLGVRYGLIQYTPGPEPKQSLTRQGLIIELRGEVNRPGLYFYTEPATASQVVADGGGSCFRRTLAGPEGNKVLTENTGLTIEHKEGGLLFRKGPLSPKALWILGRPIPLNRAGAEDLERLPGIGPMLARRIVEYRESRSGFTALEELKEVDGLKDKTFEKIKDYLSL